MLRRESIGVKDQESRIKNLKRHNHKYKGVTSREKGVGDNFLGD